jgi:hypothetical protein
VSGRLRVRRVVPGCWEVRCLRCWDDDPYAAPWSVRPAVTVVAQVGTWERAMRRAGEHLTEVHR